MAISTDERRRPVIDLDLHSLEYARDWEESARRRLAEAPIAWTEANGGHWVISKYADAAFVLADPATFSSEHDPAKPGRVGVSVPPTDYPLPLTESDPPRHTALRMTEAPFFTPKSLQKWEQVAQQHIDDALDAVIETGRIDFVDDLTIPVTAMTTMQLVGIDLAHWKAFALAAHDGAFLSRTDPAFPHAEQRLVQSKMLELLHDRRANPRDDIATAIANRVVDGAPIGDAVGVGMLSALIFGGFDTTASCTQSALMWLEGRKEDHARLLADDALLQNAVEEFLRMWPPNHGLARNALRDVEIRGKTIRAGERVLLSWVPCNRDPDKFADPETLRLDRPDAKDHLSFSGGAHKCLGAPLARIEVRRMIRSVLTRMPDYRIDRAGVIRYPHIGGVAACQHVPATFTPGPRIRREAAHQSPSRQEA